MTVNKYDELLNYFVSTDELRPVLQEPCLNGDYVVATDGHKAIKIPISLLENEYKVSEKYPNLQKIIDDSLRDHKCDGIIRLADLKEVFSKFEEIDDYGICLMCDGDGTHECECGHRHECQECDGTGDGKYKIGKKFDDEGKFCIGNAIFNANNFRPIYDIFKHFGNNHIKLLANPQFQVNVFVVGDIQIIIMPCRETDDITDISKIKVYNA